MKEFRQIQREIPAPLPGPMEPEDEDEIPHLGRALSSGPPLAGRAVSVGQVSDREDCLHS